MAEINKPYKPFNESFQFGEEAKERVANLLRAAGGFANDVDDRARYDFELQYNNHTFRVEVKNEDNYAKSGNICIETRQGWPLRVSGVADSEATIFVHTFLDNCAIYRGREMHQWLREEVREGRRYEQAFGDNNNRGFVVPLPDLFQYEWFDYGPINRLADSRLWTF